MGSFWDRNVQGIKDPVEFVKHTVDKERERVLGIEPVKHFKGVYKVEVIEETVSERHVHGKGFIIDLEVLFIEYDIKN